jgi:hypothetical protein
VTFSGNTFPGAHASPGIAVTIATGSLQKSIGKRLTRLASVLRLSLREAKRRGNLWKHQHLQGIATSLRSSQ